MIGTTAKRDAKSHLAFPKCANKRLRDTDTPSVLAVDPTPYGCGYIFFEDPMNPVDWGTTWSKHDKNRKCRSRIRELIAFHEPDVLVLEEPKGSLRCLRIRRLISSLQRLAHRQDISTSTYSQEDIRAMFTSFGGTTKFEIATIITAWLPELHPVLPPKRRIFESENERFAIFDAASFALAHYYYTVFD